MNVNYILLFRMWFGKSGKEKISGTKYILCTMTSDMDYQGNGVGCGQGWLQRDVRGK